MPFVTCRQEQALMGTTALPSCLAWLEVAGATSAPGSTDSSAQGFPALGWSRMPLAQPSSQPSGGGRSLIPDNRVEKPSLAASFTVLNRQQHNNKRTATAMRQRVQTAHHFMPVHCAAEVLQKLGMVHSSSYFTHNSCPPQHNAGSNC
jgi:hypothetical protein